MYPKMYILVNIDLGMGEGKIAGQTGHVVSSIVRLHERNKTLNSKVYDKWIREGEAKIVLKANEQEMKNLYSKYSNISEQVFDMGKTQIAPDSFTVLGFYPLVDVDVPEELLKMKLL